MEKSIERLEFLCNLIPDLLNEIEETEFSKKPNPEKWSKKEIIGHLIDSATNNHHRLIRGQFEEHAEISYNQDLWNHFGYYQSIDSKQVISFWTFYNKQLLEIIKRIPQEKLNNKVSVKSNEFTIEFIIQDYVNHMEHHLQQVVTY